MSKLINTVNASFKIARAKYNVFDSSLEEFAEKYEGAIVFGAPFFLLVCMVGAIAAAAVLR